MSRTITDAYDLMYQYNFSAIQVSAAQKCLDDAVKNRAKLESAVRKALARYPQGIKVSDKEYVLGADGRIVDRIPAVDAWAAKLEADDEVDDEDDTEIVPTDTRPSSFPHPDDDEADADLDGEPEITPTDTPGNDMEFVDNIGRDYRAAQLGYSRLQANDTNGS